MLAVPVISFAIARGLQYKFNSDWRTAVQGEIHKVQVPPESDQAKHQDAVNSIAEMRALQSIPLANVCSDSKLAQLWTDCDTVQMVDWMSEAAIGAAIVGVGLVKSQSALKSESTTDNPVNMVRAEGSRASF